MILVAGIGNVLRGDDGFGVEVARRLHRLASEHVRIVDFGIRGFDLAYALAERPKKAILIDTATRGREPGTIYVLEPSDLANDPTIDPHAMHPLRALDLARALGGVPEELRVVACEPATFGEEEVPLMELSPAVAAAVERAVKVVEEMLADA
jgi:hydrogenase maturation protease